MPTDERFALLNLRDQPVELYLEGAVVVVPPGGRAEVSAAARSSTQVQALARARHVALRPLPAPAREPEPEEPADAGEPGGGPAGGDARVDLHTADLAELEELLGNANAAKRVVEHREARGPIRTLEELRRVSRLRGPTLDRLAERIAFPEEE